MSYITDSYALSGETLVKQFKKRNMEAFYCATKEEAKEKILSMIPNGSSVTWGGTESMEEAGVCEAIRQGDYEFIDRKKAKTPEESRALYGQIVCADYFLTSSNAFTKDGILVNMDGHCNRVSCLCFGPRHVIMIVGMNKVTKDVESAISRVRNVAAPINSQRFAGNRPCQVTGSCANCLAQGCICDQLVITRNSMEPDRIHVILVDEVLGY